MSLTSYIKEKLVINKNYKSYEDDNIINNIYKAIDKARSNGCYDVTTGDCKLKNEIEKVIDIMWNDPCNKQYKEKVKENVFNFYSRNNNINNTFKSGSYKRCIIIYDVWKLNNKEVQTLFTKIYNDISKSKNYEIEKILESAYNFVYCNVNNFILFIAVNSWEKTVSEIIILEL